ncbi:MAG: hypothetical protein LC802_00225 [Acidobacteria bacterium]|nr:hypothetical protein [Acidobacteriota bacterium]
MIKNAFNALGGSARGLLRNWRALFVLNVLYAALLAALYVFFKTGVASVWQLALSALAVLLAPLLFFFLQAALALSSLWLTLLGFVLPLVAVGLWLAVARDGLKATLRGAHRVAARAFAPASVLVYAVGFFVFGLMPYFVLFTRTPVKGAWAEVLLFGLRLALAFVFTLWGWAVTLGALARVTTEPVAVNESAAVEEVPQQA